MKRGAFEWATLAVLALGAALPVFLRYLPMTDLPQHLAVAAILERFHDPALDYAQYFEVELGRTLYLVPYGLCLLFGKVVGLRLAMHAVVALAGASYLGGVALLLRARKQPAWLALLALPFVYNRAFFWGFVNFILGVGLGLLAIGLLAREPRTGRAEVLAALCALLSVLTHVYGIALLLAFAAGWALFEPRKVVARWRALVPALVGAVAWALLTREAPAFDQPSSPPFGYRLANLHHSILGGYSDASEPALLLFTLAAILWFASRALPLSVARARALPPIDRLLWLAVLGNLALYFVLPQGTASAKFIHFRHAVLAAALLPALARDDGAPERFRRLVPMAVGALALLNAAVHLFAFDREARTFDAALAAAPARARVVYLPFDSNGELLETFPYLQFGAYVEAEKGGFVAPSFPQIFWNIPVRAKDDRVPPAAPGLEFSPERFDDAYFRGFFEYALVRAPDAEAIDPAPRFPFRRVWTSPPWHLYRRDPALAAH